MSYRGTNTFLLTDRHDQIIYIDYELQVKGKVSHTATVSSALMPETATCASALQVIQAHNANKVTFSTVGYFGDLCAIVNTDPLQASLCNFLLYRYRKSLLFIMILQT